MVDEKPVRIWAALLGATRHHSSTETVAFSLLGSYLPPNRLKRLCDLGRPGVDGRFDGRDTVPKAVEFPI